MKKTKTLTIITMLLFLAVAVSPSLAARGRGMGPGGPGGGGCIDPTVLKELNLTAEQKAKISALREAHLKEVKLLHDKLFSLKGDLRLLWLEKNPDREKIAAKRKEIRGLRDQLQDKRDAYFLEVLNVLTPEQKESFRAACPGGGHGPEMWHGRDYGHGPGGPGMRGDW